MAGKPTFSRAKRFTYFHTSHKSIFDGAETQHVKTNLTASVDGNYEIKATKIKMANAVVFESTASLDSDVKIGGALHYNKFIAASSLATDPNIEGAIGLGLKGANYGWVKLYDITNATHIYSPYWRRA